MVHIAHGSDGGGSIRIPASCCGVLGLKPSRGLMPLGPLKGEGWGGLATEHMMTLSARDCAAALDISAGADVGAPYAAPALPAQSFRAIVADAARDPRAVAPRRIAWLNTTYEGDAIDPEVAAAVAEAASLFASLGHELETAAPPVGSEEVLSPMLPLIASAAAMPSTPSSPRAAPGGRRTPAHHAGRASTRATFRQYVSCVDACHEITRRVGRFLDRRDGQGYDLFLSPTLAGLPAAIGRYAMDNADYLAYRLGKKGVIGYSPFAPLANLTGMPAISIPFGLSRDGLPIGIQLMGPLGSEALLLALAAQVEAVKPWQRVAPMALAARPGQRRAPARNRERSWHRFRRIPCSTRFRPWRTIPFTRRIPRCARRWRAKARRPGRATSPPMAPGSGGRRRWPPGTRPTAIRPG